MQIYTILLSRFLNIVSRYHKSVSRYCIHCSIELVKFVSKIRSRVIVCKLYDISVCQLHNSSKKVPHNFDTYMRLIIQYTEMYVPTPMTLLRSYN